jgi:hypothetical protein
LNLGRLKNGIAELGGKKSFDEAAPEACFYPFSR